MKPLALVLWIIGWPLSVNLGRYLASLTGGAERLTPAEMHEASGYVAVTWVVVALILLFLDNPRKDPS